MSVILTKARCKQDTRSKAAAQLLIRNHEGDLERRWGHLTLSNPVGDHCNGEPPGMTDGFFPRHPVAQHPRKFERFRNSAAILFPVHVLFHVDRESHAPIVRLQTYPMSGRTNFCGAPIAMVTASAAR
jgi:hypothetical protein